MTSETAPVQTTTPAPAVQAPVGTQSLRKFTVAPYIVPGTLTLLIALASIRFFMAAFFEIPLRLEIRPERVNWNGRVFTPPGLLSRLEEGHLEFQIKERLIIYGNDTVRSLPMRGNIPPLHELWVTNNPVKSLPEDIGEQTALETLSVTNARLTRLPESIGNLTNLKYLYLYGNNLNSLPDSIGNLANLELLDLSHNNLTQLPPTLAKLEYVEVLNLTGNKLTSFPRFLPPYLKILFIGDNPIPYPSLRDALLKEGDEIYY